MQSPFTDARSMWESGSVWITILARFATTGFVGQGGLWLPTSEKRKRKTESRWQERENCIAVNNSLCSTPHIRLRPYFVLVIRISDVTFTQPKLHSITCTLLRISLTRLQALADFLASLNEKILTWSTSQKTWVNIAFILLWRSYS